MDKAQRTADAIHAWEHLSEVYRLRYLCYEKAGDCRQALDSYIRSRAYADSVKNVDNVNHIQNLRVNYERERSLREMTLLRGTYEMQQRTKNIYLLVSLFALLLVGAAAGLLWYVSRMKSRHNRAMKQMEKVRSNFFTNVTHEFRTPLTVILGLLEQLQKGGMNREELQKSIETISRQGQSLLDLVNQLLEVSKVRSEVGEPEWRTGDVVAYIRMLIENYQVYAQQKRVDLRFIPEEMSIMMDFVPEYLCKIIRNLLSNALKFTPKEGRVSLLMSRNKDKLMIYVVDTGVGIDAGDLPHIFDTFYQGENNGGSDTGSGIGLSLVKQMTECMYGHIKVESRLGEGTKFMITLPLQHGNSLWEKYLPDEKSDFFQPLSVNGGGVMLAEDYDVERAGENREINDSMHSSILIVEDNEDVSYYIDQLLKKDYHYCMPAMVMKDWRKQKSICPI
ncbi:HAMP domain-containing sensor histidine kinase [Bacteroides faecis]|nr:HAMP domain-containing sensor histidine kinase [Bacteroides faecis]